MRLPRRKFLRLAAGAAALPGFSRSVLALDYPTRPIHMIVGFPAWRRGRHRCAPDRSMAVGAARSASRHREPRGRRQQHSDGSGYPRDAGRVHASLFDNIGGNQRFSLRQCKLQLPSRYRSGGRRVACGAGDGCQSHVSRQKRSGIYRLRQSQSRQAEYGGGRFQHARCRGAVQDDVGRRYDASAVSRRRTRRSLT